MNIFELKITATHVYRCCKKCNQQAILTPNTEVWLLRDCGEYKIIYMCIVLCDECLGASSFIFSCSLQTVKTNLNIHPRKKQRTKRKKVKLLNDNPLYTVSKNFLSSPIEQNFIRGFSLPWWCN